MGKRREGSCPEACRTMRLGQMMKSREEIETESWKGLDKGKA